jgi:Flp pilus assembly protein TadD
MSRRQPPRRAGAAAPPPAPATRSWRDRWRRLLPFALVLAVVLALHGRSVGFDFTYLDDKTLILDQLAWLTRSTSLKETLGRGYLQSVDRDQAYYRPLVTLSYALDARHSGERPFGYRLTNLLLFAGCPLLLLALLRRLPLHPGVALAGALVFAVHPALTEAIAWIPGRNDTLLTLFTLAAWLLALRAFAHPSWWARLGHLLCFGAALLSKEPAVAVPLAVLAHLRLVEQRSWRELRAPWLWLGWALVLTAYTLARFNALSAPLPRGGSGLTAALLLGRVSVIFSSLGKIVLPAQLAVLAIIRDTPLWPGLVATLALALAALLLPGSRRGIAALGGLVALAFVLPGLLVADTLILENRLVMPAVGVVLVACAALDHLARQWPRAATASAGALVALLALLTWRYSDDFRGRRPFAEAAVRGSPHAPLAWVHLGTTLQREGDVPGAERAYREVLRLDAREPIAHNNLGVLLLGQGRAAEAEAVLRTETVINPRYARAHFNLGLALRQLGRLDQAVACWERALELEPENVDTLGQLLGAYQGRDPARARAIIERLSALGIQLAAPPPSP